MAERQRGTRRPPSCPGVRREDPVPSWGRRVRGQSNVIGVVILIGMVITSATLIVLAGSSVLDQYRELSGQESTTNAIEEIDTELSSVASVGGLTRTEFSLGDARPSQYRVVRSGHVNVTANRNANCRAHIPLSSLRYERNDGVTLAFESGGIWRQENGVLSQTVMHAPPDFTFEKGAISLSVINVSGEVTRSKNLVYEDVGGSISTNEAIQDAIFNGDCARPDNVTVSVTSDFYRGWGYYFGSSIDATDHWTFESNNTARVFFAQDILPEETDDRKNNVVNLNDSDFNDIDITSNSIQVNKSANNTYTTVVTPLSAGSTQVGEIRVVEDGAAYRPPIDVVFVVDESGSMGDDPDGDGDDKYEEAQVAAKAFVGKMNESYDRAGVVGFDSDASIKVTDNGSYITNDFDDEGVNGSIDDLSASGYTDIGSGVHEANVVLGLESNSSRNKVMLVLGDGENQDPFDPDCDDLECMNQKSFDEAEISNKDGITIHTVGFGDPDNETMEDIAHATGGTYRYVDDSDDLTEVFLDLFAEISESRQVVRDPFSMQVEAGGATFQPQIDGETQHIANGTDGELNLNDPTAPTEFSYSIDVSDGENVSMTAIDYDCDQWSETGTVYENQTTGQEYVEVRCTAINQSSRTEIPASSTNVYVDGDNVSSLLDEPSNWWDEDLQNETLDGYLRGSKNHTLSLESNQALVVFEFDDGDGAADRLVVLYQIGQSEEAAVPKHAFNIEVRRLVIESES